MAFGGQRNFGGPRQLFDAVCANCNQPTQVPFKPDPSRPVYCRDCYRQMKGQ